MNSNTIQQRFHYMDNLRALAMLAGVVFHASLAYSPMLHFFWLSADHQSSKSIDVIAWFSHPLTRLDNTLLSGLQEISISPTVGPLREA